MKCSPRIVTLFLSCVALAWCAAAPAWASIIVTVFAGTPGGAGNGTPNLDLSALTQLDTFTYYGAQFGIESGNNWRPLYRDTDYTVRIVGQLNVAATGNYTFSTTSDDGSVLRIDNNAVVNNNFNQAPTTRTGSVVLPAGAHNFELLFYQAGGGKSLDFGSGPGSLINQLPAGVTLVSPSNLPQLQVNVYADTPAARRYDVNTGAIVNPNNPLIGTILAPDVNFDYATGNQWSPFGRGDDYSVSITGFLSVAAAGNYVFGLNSDDGSWLFINDEQVVNNGGPHGSNQASGTRGTAQNTGSVFLEAGLHAFEVRMFEAGGGAGVNLYLPNGVTYATQQQVIPEPSSLLLAGGASLAGGLVAYARRRRKARA